MVSQTSHIQTQSPFPPFTLLSTNPSPSPCMVSPLAQRVPRAYIVAFIVFFLVFRTPWSIVSKSCWFCLWKVCPILVLGTLLPHPDAGHHPLLPEQQVAQERWSLASLPFLLPSSLVTTQQPEWFFECKRLGVKSRCSLVACRSLGLLRPCVAASANHCAFVL